MRNNSDILAINETADGKLEIIIKAIGEEVIKKVFMAKDGKVILQKTIRGRHTTNNLLGECFAFHDVNTPHKEPL